MGCLVYFQCSMSNVFLSNIYKWVKTDEMNKFTLFLVFLCGVAFASLVSFLRNIYSSDPGMFFLPGTDLALMDDGYVMMSELGAGSKCSIKSLEKIVSNQIKTDLKKRSSEVEAVNSLKAAIDLMTSGKTGRAGRLLEHAHSLAPHHHDILLYYGEYMEKHKNDLVQADHLYLKALSVAPSSLKAKRHRQRTLPLVEKLDSSTFSRIEDKRDELAMIPLSSSPLRRIQREAYFQHIYHTASIEGNTLTLAQIRMILETGLSVGGKSVTEHNEVLGIDLALKYINTTLVHRIGKITLTDILEIHKRVLGHVDPVNAGTLRNTQVFVSNHAPPAPTDLEMLLEGFLTWLNSEETQKMHPIKYAALAHYKLVFIHPFVDGNGRTARLLMNFLLMQAGYPPVIIRKQDRLQYYEYLQTANEGDTRPFIRFVGHCLEKMIDVYLWATKDHFPEIEQHVSQPPDEGSHDVGIIKAKLNAVAFLNRADMFDDRESNDESGFVLDDTMYSKERHDDGYESEPHEWLLDTQSHKEKKDEEYGRILGEGDIHNTVQEVMVVRDGIKDEQRDCDDGYCDDL